MKQCSYGIDEAGYGPLLGPLVVGLVGFDAPRPQLLEGTLRVADSKRLLSRRHGLAEVEAVVLGLSELSGQRAETLGEWLDEVASGVSESLQKSPWNDALHTALPIFATSADTKDAASIINQGGLYDGGAFRGFHLAVFSARMFNEQVGTNKHSMLSHTVMKLIDAARDPSTECRVLVDRLGGRRRYEPLLVASFPFVPVTIEEEVRGRSCYEVGFQPHPATVSFEVGGDDTHFEIALASMAAKYVREALMHLFNEFWLARVPGIQPTKGYYTDGQRFLSDLAEAGVLDEVDSSDLVRCR